MIQSYGGLGMQVELAQVVPLVGEETIQEITRRIVKAFAPEKIILFGSYAYGVPTPDSDVDLLVVMGSDDSPALRSTKVAKVARPRHVALSVIVRTPAEIKRRLEMGDFFIQEVLEKGRVLYDRNAG
jgi:predicted nucleotidyltransferase